MNDNIAYLDSSAFLKLFLAEPESAQLHARLKSFPNQASAMLLRTEVMRALRRSGNEYLVGHARRLFRTIHLIRLDELLLDLAGDLEPTGLRSLDAIHLAAALSMGSTLSVLFTYDDRLREAALRQGVEVESPK